MSALMQCCNVCAALNVALNDAMFVAECMLHCMLHRPRASYVVLHTVLYVAPHTAPYVALCMLQRAMTCGVPELGTGAAHSGMILTSATKSQSAGVVIGTCARRTKDRL